MKIEVNIEKKHFFGLLALGLIVLGVVGVIAYGTSTPNVFGHSVGEINWNDDIPKLCMGGMCITSWAGIGGGASTENLSVTGTIRASAVEAATVQASGGVILGSGLKIRAFVASGGANTSCPSNSVTLATRYASKTCGSSGTCVGVGSPSAVGSCTTAAGWGSSSASCTYYTPSTNGYITTCNAISCRADAVEVLCAGSA